MSGKQLFQNLKSHFKGDFIESICYLYIHKGFLKVKWNISSTDRNKPFQSIVQFIAQILIRGYKTWSENSCAVRASQAANEKQSLASEADSTAKTLLFFFKEADLFVTL